MQIDTGLTEYATLKQKKIIETVNAFDNQSKAAIELCLSKKHIGRNRVSIY